MCVYSHHGRYRVQYTSVHSSCRYSASDRLSYSYRCSTWPDFGGFQYQGPHWLPNNSCVLCSHPQSFGDTSPVAQMIGCLPCVLSLKDCSSCLLKKFPLCWWNIFQHSSFTNEQMEYTHIDNGVTSCTVRLKNRSKLFITSLLMDGGAYAEVWKASVTSS